MVNDGSRNIYNDKFGIVVNDRPENVVIVNDRSEKVAKNQLFVWPWMGIVANIATEFKDGRRTGDSGSKLRDEFTLKGFHPLKVQPLWNRYGHSGFAIVEFSKDWEGFTNAMNFGRSFEAEHCGGLLHSPRDLLHSLGGSWFFFFMVAILLLPSLPARL